MLAELSIRDVVLIEKLDLCFQSGLNVLTGETGAGKSILLDSLGLTLGMRSDSALVRTGAPHLSVTARFNIALDHPAFSFLAEQGIHSDAGEDLVLRRTVGQDGRSRAFVNDQPVSATFLRQLGASLVEIHGQFDTHGLLDSATHTSLLDTALANRLVITDVAKAWRHWQKCNKARKDQAERLAKIQKEEEYLRHISEELEKLGSQTGEEEELAAERTRLMQGEKITTEINQALASLNPRNTSVSSIVRNAQRGLERVAERLQGVLDAPLAALDRAAQELDDAGDQLERLLHELAPDPHRLERVEERLFGLRAAGRKHNVTVDALPAFHEEIKARLAALDGGLLDLEKLEQEEKTAYTAYCTAAAALSSARKQSAAALDAAVMNELPPLKLDKARFQTRLDILEEKEWGAGGMERAVFEVSTNPGSAFGALGKIASGGELSRFTLALKVVLAAAENQHALIFDEVDSGIGGAVADAVGERLARLAENRQVLVVTHSPQVAARGQHHWHVSKHAHADRVATVVAALSPEQRQEELARMLSGAEITTEARAAAARLLDAAS